MRKNKNSINKEKTEYLQSKKNYIKSCEYNPELDNCSRIFLNSIEKLDSENKTLFKENEKFKRKAKEIKRKKDLGAIVGGSTGLLTGSYFYNNYSDFLSGFGSYIAKQINSVSTTDEFRPANEIVKDYAYLLPENIKESYLANTDISILENLVRESYSTLSPVSGERMQRIQGSVSDSKKVRESPLMNLIRLRQKIRNTTKAPFVSKEKEQEIKIRDSFEYADNYYKLNDISTSILNKIKEIDLGIEKVALKMKVYETEKGLLDPEYVSSYKSLVKERVALCDSLDQIREFKGNTENIEDIYLGKNSIEYSQLVNKTKGLAEEFDPSIYGDSTAFLGSFLVGYLAYKISKSITCGLKGAYDIISSLIKFKD